MRAAGMGSKPELTDSERLPVPFCIRAPMASRVEAGGGVV
jgi:hypothetical protein